MKARSIISRLAACDRGARRLPCASSSGASRNAGVSSRTADNVPCLRFILQIAPTPLRPFGSNLVFRYLTEPTQGETALIVRFVTVRDGVT